MTAAVDDLMRGAIKARQRANSALREAVHEARAAGWSWERISSGLGGSPDTESLRRAFAVGEPADSDAPPEGGCGECGGGCGCGSHG